MVDGSPCDESIGFEERAGMTNQLRYQRRIQTIDRLDVWKNTRMPTVCTLELDPRITSNNNSSRHSMIRVNAATFKDFSMEVIGNSIIATKKRNSSCSLKTWKCL